MACGTKDFLYLSVWKQSCNSVFEKVLYCLSSGRWRGCSASSTTDISFWSIFLSITFWKLSNFRPITEPTFLMISSSLLVSVRVSVSIVLCTFNVRSNQSRGNMVLLVFAGVVPCVRTVSPGRRRRGTAVWLWVGWSWKTKSKVNNCLHGYLVSL